MTIELNPDKIIQQKEVLRSLARSYVNPGKSTGEFSMMRRVSGGDEQIAINFDDSAVGLKPNELVILPDQTLSLFVGVSYNVLPPKLWFLVDSKHSAPGIFHWPGSTKADLLKAGFHEIQSN